MSKRRVVVTGLGLVTPVGNDVETTWRNILVGRSGIGPIESFDVSAYSTRIGGSIKDLDVSRYMEIKDARRMDLFMQYGLCAAIQAVEDAGLTQVDEATSERVGVAIGAGGNGLELLLAKVAAAGDEEGRCERGAEQAPS